MKLGTIVKHKTSNAIGVVVTDPFNCCTAIRRWPKQRDSCAHSFGQCRENLMSKPNEPAVERIAQLMLDEINRECECGNVHSLTEFFEADMREMLRRFHINLIQKKYGPR